MKTNRFESLALIALLLAALPVRADDLEVHFQNPPEATRPRCYWYWMDGQVTREGITRDLEAMKRAGIGEGYIGIISGQAGTPVGVRSKAFTEEWWGHIEHAIREGGRLGVDIGLFNSPGWSQSGGPWVKPQQAMRYITLPELRLRGPQKFSGELPAPPGEIQDLAVLAFPAPAGEGTLAPVTSRTPTLVRFVTATGLVTQLLEAREERQLQRLHKQLERLDLIVLDELGYVPFSKAGAELLFEVVSRAYERTSLILTTNLPFEQWTEVLGSERLTGAMLDRLTHRVHILEANGPSYRLADAKRRLKRK